MASKEYKQIKNFIHNDMGVNRGVVDDIIKSHIEERLKHHLDAYLNSRNMEELFSEMVSEKLLSPDSKWTVCRGWPARPQGQSTNAFIKEMVKSSIEKLFREKFEIKIAPVPRIEVD